MSRSSRVRTSLWSVLIGAAIVFIVAVLFWKPWQSMMKTNVDIPHTVHVRSA